MNHNFGPSGWDMLPESSWPKSFIAGDVIAVGHGKAIVITRVTTIQSREDFFAWFWANWHRATDWPPKPPKQSFGRRLAHWLAPNWA